MKPLGSRLVSRLDAAGSTRTAKNQEQVAGGELFATNALFGGIVADDVGRLLLTRKGSRIVVCCKACW